MESNLQNFCNLRNRKRKGITAGQRANKLQDNYATCEMDNFNLRNFRKLHLNLRNPPIIWDIFRKLHLNLRNPPIIWDICESTLFDIYLQIFVCKSLFSPCTCSALPSHFVFSLFLFLENQTLRMFSQRMSG